MNKIDLKGYKGFKILKSDHSLEANRLHAFCYMNDIPLLKLDPSNIFTDEFIPCGSVEWCEQLLGQHIKPDYYPEWLQDSLYRKVWQSNDWILGRKLFIKPSDKYKRFTGFVTTGTYKKKKKPPFWYSELITFENEWRYYITEGVIECASWYWGDEINTPNPPLFPALEALKSIPKDFCGAIDFGMTKDSKFVLIESQHPFACGWYGPQEYDKTYFQWLIDGWIYMKELINE
jgi:hypothetical protein